MSGVDAQNLLKLSSRLSHAALLHQGNTEIKMSRRQIGFKPDQLLELRKKFFEILVG